MAINYKKLWKLRIDNQMNKGDIFKTNEISSYTATKLNKNEHVILEMLKRICKDIHCGIGEVMESTW